MRKNLLAALLCLSLGIITTRSSAQSVLMYYWSFNSWTPAYTAATPGVSVYANISPDYGAVYTDTAKARFIDRTMPGTSSAYASYADATTGDTLNAQLGAGAGNCFRARNPNDSLELLIYASTVHYYNLQIRYACELSSYSSGDSINVFSYSVDSGTTWITSGSGLTKWADSGSTAFRLITVSVTDTNAFNNRKFVFRINLVGRNRSTSGNNRIDNFTINGDSTHTTSHLSVVPVPAATEYSLFPNPASSQLKVTSSSNGQKTVIITNMIGQRIYGNTASGREISINTSSFVAGPYFLTVREIETGEVNTLQFIKQ